MSRLDPHSYWDDTQPRTRHLHLRLRVDFASKTLDGEAFLDLDRDDGHALDLDTKGLEIHAVYGDDGEALRHALADEEPVLGRRLRIELPSGTRRVRVAYRTSPDALGLQWLEPAQTAGRRLPFLFSQCQAIHARTLAPLQDTPRVRTPYSAEIDVPQGFAAVMSAGPAGDQPGPEPGRHTFAFRMPQPIPPYLLALAVGDLAARDLSPRARVWAEPATVEAAAWEFAGVEDMIRAAEGLFGPYAWERYDMLVLPPSFPYGGMENPRMTFLTPTLLAGDRSLVDVVAHELAHSWTGNLVTNADMQHFWLNEGFTVWAERRILEALHGADAASLGWALGETALEEALRRFGADSPLTRLRTELVGIDPDDAFSSLPYEKGARFVALLERTAGREAFDAFLREYMARFRFGALTSEEFIAFVEEQLPGLPAQVGADAWLYEPGLPQNAPAFRSERLEQITRLAAEWETGRRPGDDEAGAWNPTELQVYLQRLPRRLDADACAWLDRRFGLAQRGNYEILVEWLAIAAGSDYEPAFARLREVLTRVGRMKYLRPLYAALGGHARTRALAREVFAAAAPGYHALSRRVAAAVIEQYPAD